MLVNSKYLLEDAMRNNYAVPAITIIDEHTLRGVMKAIKEMHIPCILQCGKTRENLEVYGPQMITIAKTVDTPVAINLDHGANFEMVKLAIANGFNSVMIDGSSLPYEENIRVTKEVVEYAHYHGVPVEAELGHVGQGEDYEDKAQLKSLFTDPDQANDFIAKTGIDSLAVAIGTAHGEYKGTPQIDFERLAELRSAIKIPLVLHGGSGTGKENLIGCVKGGINKINLCTDLHKAANAYIIENAGKMQYPALVEGIREAVYQEMMRYKPVFVKE